MESTAANGTLAELLACPACGSSLERTPTAWRCRAEPERSSPIVRGIPRFVPERSYADSFGFQWQTHPATQLDSLRGGDASEREFRAKTGFAPADLRGRRVLDAGVGAGRYADVMTRWGAEVVGVDLSPAVEAAHRNLGDRPNFHALQADIGALPFRAGVFDAIVSIGVLHHTPDAREHFRRLLRFLRPGGTIAIWVYPDDRDYAVRRAWIPFTSRIPTRLFHAWCEWYVHFVRRRPDSPFLRWARHVLPANLHGADPEHDVLELFDGYSPRYHEVHGPEAVRRWFVEEGLEDVRAPSDWRTCMRGRLPEPAGAGR